LARDGDVMCRTLPEYATNPDRSFLAVVGPDGKFAVEGPTGEGSGLRLATGVLAERENEASVLITPPSAGEVSGEVRISLGVRAERFF
jgi:hypothetical protein